ncbi:unnamed protein product [Acanthoscelides obtectus]|uniref:Nuclease HARBI1 n=1 Tax=Acanthoscelides obtectus TaxID=200917 RepID=A0A9P0PQT3_ACAOB|nr:unnamed protein product [Acanthoscelides obtectus]CAK1624515.1 hypothetical protein AOBTE_LOCUS2583 [Acanthoscelides obtectus]
MDDETILTLLLLEKEEDDDYLIRMSLKKKRRGKHELFVKRNKEEYFRVSEEQFTRVLKLIENDITRQPSKRYRNPIFAAEKLGVTVRYLATGESMRSLAFQFRISHNYISIIMRQTLKVLCEHLVPLYLPTVTEDI